MVCYERKVVAVGGIYFFRFFVGEDVGRFFRREVVVYFEGISGVVLVGVYLVFIWIEEIGREAGS